MRNWLEINPSTVVLTKGELAPLRIKGGACRVTCVTGRLWVTASGRAEDTVLTPGQAATFAGKGRIVIEALRTATVRLEMRAPSVANVGAPVPFGRLPARLFQ
jgi:hypothetical protein